MESQQHKLGMQQGERKGSTRCTYEVGREEGGKETEGRKGGGKVGGRCTKRRTEGEGGGEVAA